MLAIGHSTTRWKYGLIIAFKAALLHLSLHAQNPSLLVNHMVQNERNAAQNDHSCWMYKDIDSEKGKNEFAEVVETPQGWMRRLIL